MTDILPQITKQNYRKKSLNYRDPKLPRKMPQITVLSRFSVMFHLQCFSTTALEALCDPTQAISHTWDQLLPVQHGMAHRDSKQPYLAVWGKKMIPLLCGWMMMMMMSMRSNAVVTNSFVMKGPLCHTFHLSSVVSLSVLHRKSLSFHPAKDQGDFVSKKSLQIVGHCLPRGPLHVIFPVSSSSHCLDFGLYLTLSRNFFVAEALRTIDGTYLDWTFNGQDWFKMC
jgi:hypothetical protein